MLRGNIDASEYKSVVLGLIFLKYISDRFEAKYAEIGTKIDDAMRSIEKENKRLKDILPKNFARPDLDKMFAKSHELEKEIKARLGAIGYEN